MNNSVSIETFFNSPNERTIEYLSMAYSDRQRLMSVVERMMNAYLSVGDIDGKSVLLKPNWVREELNAGDYLCLRTNDNLLLCILEVVLKMSPSKVLIADAPIQGCKWEKMITPVLTESINSLSSRYSIPVLIKDFRRTVWDRSKNKVDKDLHDLSNYVIFDLGKDSYLEPITTDKNRFRVTLYNPDRMAEVHHKGMHKFCIAKDVFDYDVIITIPKLKTHRMAGITNSLKLLIGINGDKDYLPHHRIGSVSEGGDNYKDKSIMRNIANAFKDAGNRRRGTTIGRLLDKAGASFWILSRPDSATLGNAGWYGNDTIWRTVLDLNTIALYGDSKGIIHKEKKRKLVTIMDGIISGQGEGPLHPYPCPLGVLAISDNPYLMDVAACNLYHLNSEKIPLIKEALNILKDSNYSVFINSVKSSMENVRDFGIDIELTSGWKDYDKN